MYRYIHGSEDSTDTDVIYVFEKMPDLNTCKTFCSENPEENRNIIIVKDGQVSECFIGTIDEINNALIDTYPLHHQDYPLIITKRCERNIIIKQIRAVRGILSIMSRTPFRKEIKAALKANWSQRINCLESIKLKEVDFSNLQKTKSNEDMLKVIAFQIGQGLGLLEGYELYTKSSIAKVYPLLKDFLYRKKNPSIDTLQEMVNRYLIELKKIKYEEEGIYAFFPEYNKKYEMKHEIET